MGDIVLLGDFRVQTKVEHTTMFDSSRAMPLKIMAEKMEVTAGLSQLHKAPTYAFPHTTGNAPQPKPRRVIQNSWYD
mgnify:CR=1 FL=1